MHKMEATFDTGDLLLEETFPLSSTATLADYMAQVEALLPGMVRRLLREMPALLANARPQGEGTYWPCPHREGLDHHARDAGRSGRYHPEGLLWLRVHLPGGNACL